MKYCPFCGEALPVASARFCPECGEPFDVPARPIGKRETIGETAAAGMLWQQPPGLPNEPDALDIIDVQPVQTIVGSQEDFLSVDQDDQASYNDAAYSDTVYDNSPQPAPELTAKPAKAAKRMRSGKGMIFLIIICSLLVLGCAAGYLVLSMNADKAPAQAAKAFTAAVAAGDYQYVTENIEAGGSGLAYQEDVKRMLASMQENLDMNMLRNHLTASVAGAVGGDGSYSCFTLKQTKDSLFSQKFVVKIDPVQVLVKTTVPDMTLYVDGKKAAATQAENGLMLNVGPGTHSLRAVYEAYGPEYELGTSELTGFSAKDPVEVTVTKNLATAEIELAGTETGLQVLIDNVKTDVTAAGGFIALNPAFVGMKITVKCDQYTQDFAITAAGDNSFSADYIAQAEQQSQGGAPAEMTNRQLINSAAPSFYSFYQSYLEAINRWDKRLIQNVSADYLTDLLQKMEAYNKDLLFDFHGMTFDRLSLSRSVKNGELFVSFRVKVDFNYAYKSDNSKWFAGGNYQSATMHYLPATNSWEVFATSVKDEMEMSSNVFTINA